MAPRLSLDTLPASMPDGVSAPKVDPRGTSVGIVHLGIGAFHRAHQAVYTEDAMAATGESRWGILGVTQRSRTVMDQLEPQDCLYSVLTKGSQETSLRVMGAVRGVAFPAEQTGPILAAIASDNIRVVSTTITEKGYCRDGDGNLDLTHPGVQSDIVAATATVSRTGSAGASTSATGLGTATATLDGTETSSDQAGGSGIGILARGIIVRALADGAPLNMVTCDNLTDNGRLTKQLVLQFIDQLPTGPRERITEWVERNVAFPSTMVDRIVPATTEENKAEAQAMLGLVDEGLVVGEPFRQWVIEDAFVTDRPAWEQVGAILTDDVASFEAAKLRILNGVHSMLAYGGSLRGRATMADAMADPELAAAAESMLREDILPTLKAPDGLDLKAYAASVLDRFRNPNTRHTTIQVAMDGSQKIPIRWLGTVADRLNAGAMPDAMAFAVAQWIRFVARGEDVNGRELPLNDPRADALRAAAAGPADGLLDRMLGLREVFPAEIAEHPGFRAAVAAHL